MEVRAEGLEDMNMYGMWGHHSQCKNFPQILTNHLFLKCPLVSNCSDPSFFFFFLLLLLSLSHPTSPTSQHILPHFSDLQILHLPLLGLLICITTCGLCQNRHIFHIVHHH